MPADSAAGAPRIVVGIDGDFATGARKKIDAVISDEIQPADSRLSGARSSAAIRRRSC